MIRHETQANDVTDADRRWRHAMKDCIPPGDRASLAGAFISGPVEAMSEAGKAVVTARDACKEQSR